MQYDDIFLKTIDSTQEYAKKNVKSFDPKKITCIFTEKQTKGKGRFQRKWLSSEDDLIVTFYFQLNSNTLHLTSINHILTLSLIDILREKNLNPKIKWPNDIMLSEKKVGGVLSEVQTKNAMADIFLGIGINVNSSKEFIDKIDQKATSLKLETNKIWNKKDLLKNLKQNFLINLTLFKEKGFTPFHEKYENLLLYVGEKITFFDGVKEHKGILHSINCEGKLNLFTSDKKIISFAAGDIIS
jgi:BirA family biotin operon repressor/biotin-[acetyl-CoA-carboxylase] ligase